MPEPAKSQTIKNSSVRRPMGLKNVHIAKLTEDKGDSSKYENPVAVKNVEDLQYAIKYAEGNAYSDDIQDTNIKVASSADLTATFAHYLPEIANLIQGNNTSLGGKVVKTDDLQDEFALMYEVVNSDKTITYKIFYRCKLSCDGETNKTKGENIEFAKFQLTGKALPLSNGVIFREFNSSEKLNSEVISNFYKKVLAPNEKIITD